MDTDKVAINWQNFARAQLQLNFAFIIRHLSLNKLYNRWQLDVEEHKSHFAFPGQGTLTNKYLSTVRNKIL